MDHFEVEYNIPAGDSGKREMVIALLASDACSGILENGHCLRAYFPENKINNNQLIRLLKQVGHVVKGIDYRVRSLKDKNWNEEWEKNFPPVVVEDQCLIHAPFHTVTTNYPYQILLEPKMAFGTGHHPSTRLMILAMLGEKTNLGSVLDVGCGTGILSILAEKMGSARVLALDNNASVIQNAKENIRKNHCTHIRILEGELSGIEPGAKFTTILANIKLDVIMNDLNGYIQLLEEKGMLILGGILTEQADRIKTLAGKHAIRLVRQIKEMDWSSLIFKAM